MESLIRATPACIHRLLLSAKPALAIIRIDHRLIIVLLAGKTVDALAGIETHVAFNRRLAPGRVRHAAVGRPDSRTIVVREMDYSGQRATAIDDDERLRCELAEQSAVNDSNLTVNLLPILNLDFRKPAGTLRSSGRHRYA